MTKFYKVGGAVRDEIMRLKVKDIDYAVECESFDAMREEILKRGGKIFVETPKFFTIRAMMPAPFGAADFVLCRKDGEYVDGRRPEGVTAGTIFDDLARRDFTMNAIAVDCETGAILDPHCGIQDIESKKIRCVGNPIVRFTEDKLRIFRAVRFAVTKGFGIDPETAIAMRKYNYKDFAGVSTERIRDELFKAFSHDTFKAVRRITDDFPELGWVMREREIWLKPTVEARQL